MENEKKVVAVLVTYNRVDLLKRCVDSLLCQSYKLNNIIIVNNNSTDKTYDYLSDLAGKDDTFIPIHLTENTGGAGGFSVGVDAATNLDVDYVWIMDDDAIPHHDALQHLLLSSSMLHSDGIKFGFLCSHVLSDNNETMNVPTVSNKVNSTGYPIWSTYVDRKIVEVDKATFVSVLVPKEIIMEVGLPIREMFIWGDDIEYTWRISSKYRCFYVSESKVWHKRVLAKSLSLIHEDNDIRMSWYKFMYRNNIYNYRTHGSVKSVLLMLITASRDFFKILKKSENKKIKRISILFSGVLSGLFFNPKIRRFEDK